jgi:hypothetical protein
MLKFGLTGMAIGLALGYLVNSFVQGQFDWYLLMYNGEGVDEAERFFALVIAVVMGAAGGVAGEEAAMRA